MVAKRTRRMLKDTTVAGSNGLIWICVLLLLGASVTSGGIYDGLASAEAVDPGLSANGESYVISDLSVLGGPAVLTGEVTWFEDFELGWGDWYPDYGVWEIGVPTSGPGSAHQGVCVAGTVLGGDYPGYQDSRLIGPVFALPMATGDERIQLRFWHWFSYSSYDSGTVQISLYDARTGAWGGWTSLATVSGVSAVWSTMKVDLTAYAGQYVQIGFLHTADRSSQGYASESSGWYIDELEIWRGVPTFVNPETFEFGWGDWHADNGVWEIGKPISGPGGAYQGLCAAGTVLGADYPGYQDSRLISPAIVLPTATGDERIQLRLWHWFSYSTYDSGTVQISVYDTQAKKWADWTSLATLRDISAVWSPMMVDLTAYAGQYVQIGFLHTADRSSQGYASESSGWYIDELEIWRGVPTFVNPATFELGWGDWHADNGVWEIGRSNIVPPSFVSGGNCAGTVLNGNYPGYTDSRLVSPMIQMPELSSLSLGVAMELRFWHWFSYSTYDRGTVQIRVYDPTTGSWSDCNDLTSINGVSAVWSPMRIPLSAYAGKQVQIVFLHTADRSSQGYASESSGWYIDDVQITPSPESWSLSEDTGCSRTDKLTNDATPELTFVFPQTVRGVNSDIQITNPGGLAVVPNSISGWGSNKVTVSITTPLVKNGDYTVTLKGTITDSQGKAIHGGVDKVLHFTLDTTPPRVTRTVTNDVTTRWSGTIDDPEATIKVTVGADSYVARNNGNGTWILPGDMMGLASPDRRVSSVVEVSATDRAGNTGKAPDPGVFSLTVSVTGQGSTDPNIGVHSYPGPKTVPVTASSDNCHPFVRWEGTAVEAGKIKPNDPHAPAIEVIVDGRYTLTAVFTDEVVVYSFPLDKDPGWERNGQWAFGPPKGKGGQHGCPDPTSAYTGQNVFGVNLDGDYDLTTGLGLACSLVAGPFNLSNYKDVKLRFARWLNTDEPEYVGVGIEVSSDGMTWYPVSVWGHTTERTDIVDCQWKPVEYPLGARTDGQPIVYLHWWYKVRKARAYAYSGWNIDDIQLIGKCK